MNPSRKQFLRQAALLATGAIIPGKKLFADIWKSKRMSLSGSEHPMDCTINLAANDFFTESSPQQIDSAIFSYGKSLNIDVQYDDENQPPSDPCLPGYVCGVNEKRGTNSLQYKVWYPIWDSAIHNYDMTPLPAIILFHAGAYSDCAGSWDVNENQIEILARTLARKGFIAFSVQYRCGRIIDRTVLGGGHTQGFTSAQQELAVYRAQQDGRGAIRSILKRNNVSTLTDYRHNNSFIINTDQIFIGGMSAGSGIANGVAFYGNNQSIINAVFPKKGGSGYPTVEQTLGHIKEAYYYDELYGVWPNFAGLLNCWGGLGIPISAIADKSTFFTGIPLVPMIAFQDAKDNVVYYNDDLRQPVYYSQTGTPYVQENLCTNLTSPTAFVLKSTPLYVPEYTILCTLDMHCYLKSQNVNTELYISKDMHHGINDYTTDNFGIAASSIDDVIHYIGQRTACFFQALMNGKKYIGNTGRSYFLDCENYRAGGVFPCLWGNANNGCSDPNPCQ